MAMLVGFLVEGWDYLILQAYLAKVLELPEEELQADWIDRPGRGWQFVLDMVPKALRRFYNQCAQFAVIGMDNDGNLDLMQEGLAEDPKHPRHWLHAGQENPPTECRWCQLHGRVEATRPVLNWLPQKPGDTWPILIAVPVEMIESWLLVTRAILHHGQGSLYAENESRSQQKQQFYGKPESTKQDVETAALPLIRAMQTLHLESLQQYSKSFAQFAEQVCQHRDKILGDRDCW